MRRRVAVIGVAVLLLLGLASLGARWLLSPHSGSGALLTARASICADTYSLLKLTPSQISAADRVCFTESLQLSGQLNGEVAKAFVVSADSASPGEACSEPARWGDYPQAMLAIAVDGKPYRLRISPPGWSEHQALNVKDVGRSVELASMLDPTQDWNQVTGSLVVNPDGVSGTVDVDAMQDVSGATPVHISGQWACATSPVVPSPDASVPCSSFYRLNGLQAADVERMKAKACHGENLTFEGAITTHLDHAISDTVAPYVGGGYGADNFCGPADELYVATLKFTVGNESFLLDLTATMYPAIKPGRYSAASSGSSPGVVMFLGHADAANHGAFVTNDNVVWTGSGGNFTIAADLRSGTIDATLSGLLEHSSSVVHITGSWRCAA